MSDREKLAVRLESELRERLDRCYTMDGSRSRREYIENAIRFYTDYQELQGTQSLMPKEIATALDGRLGMLEDRMASLLFKQSVELDMVVGVLSCALEMDEETLRRLRAESVKNVKQTNGRISLEQRMRCEDDL